MSQADLSQDTSCHAVGKTWDLSLFCHCLVLDVFPFLVHSLRLWPHHAPCNMIAVETTYCMCNVFNHSHLLWWGREKSSQSFPHCSERKPLWPKEPGLSSSFIVYLVNLHPLALTLFPMSSTAVPFAIYPWSFTSHVLSLTPSSLATSVPCLSQLMPCIPSIQVTPSHTTTCLISPLTSPSL